MRARLLARVKRFLHGLWWLTHQNADYYRVQPEGGDRIEVLMCWTCGRVFWERGGRS